MTIEELVRGAGSRLPSTDGRWKIVSAKTDGVTPGFTIEDPGECGTVLDQALSASGPVIIEAVVDPFEPPMPPKVSVDQATKFAQSLMRGQPNRDKIALTVLEDRVRELV